MIVSFNGTTVTPDPSECSIGVQDISSADSGRSSTNARMQKIVIAKKNMSIIGKRIESCIHECDIRGRSVSYWNTDKNILSWRYIRSVSGMLGR